MLFGGRGRGYPKTFGPTSLPNTMIWARVEDAQVARSGAEALSLNDQTSNARHFGGSSVGNRPTFNLNDAAFNNRATFTHVMPGSAGYGQWLDCATWSVSPTPPFAIALVGSHDGTFDNYTAIVDTAVGTQRRYYVGTVPTSGHLSLYGGSFLSSTVVAGAPFVMIAQFNGDGSSAIYVNNMTTPVVTGDAGASSGTDFAMRLGTAAGSQIGGWIGKSAFVAAWNRQLSHAERNHIAKDTTTSLGPYYGITVT